jgi:hypothetical protein
MIRISCTNCKTILTIDDAFAGGVCRCQHCGTIQTVPAQAKEASAVGAGGQSMGGGKLLYQNDARSGTGLDELAGIVVSSGLTSSRLSRKPSGQSKSSKSTLPLIFGAVAIILVLVVIIVIMAMRGGSPASGGGDNAQTQTSTNSGAGTAAAGGTAVTVVGPSFCGTKIDGSTVVYLLDCGEATRDFLGDLKDASIRSISSLGPDHKFQILFWGVNGNVASYPDGSTTYATKESIDAAQKSIADQPAFGQSDVIPALKAALEQHPDAIVLATGKGWDLDNNWVTDVMKMRGASGVRIDTFNLGSTDSPPLKSLASKTGGSYRTVGKSDLRGE